MNVKCPICEKPVTWSEKSPYRPFCSKQCQLIDLGEWASEERSIAQKASHQAVPDEEDIEAMLAEQQDNFFKH
ncbi:DNA gyrase inhibitor YacG [Alteromonas halophila]|uniref:DNA gyrase inhibitor YacG n=1 Tax=Alteromonas halophila TaxID=516698 RepID=A0A918JS78_9ALTE|nr:DNA gyrase inhibitor YacG [Alteromonas halophila]GGW94072.1 hypothetical protein GCM10007391_30470 [Alteromonas halophila]